MLFNSYVFIFAFLPLALIGYFLLNHYGKVRLAKAWLILASFYFYSYWNIQNLPILVLSILTNHFLASYLHDKTKKVPDVWLIRTGLAFNIGLLCFFKYGGFILPLGISFFTLQQIAFLVDTYQGVAERKSLLDYAFFVSFFPQLVSGPIVHHSLIMPQYERPENKLFNVSNFTTGLFIFIMGLVKKVLISDTFSDWARPGFDELATLDFFAAWKTSLSYTFQLYFDFSGYTDMAVGVGYMFNLRLPQNFNSPFRSKTVIEFWTRWHMTLGQFIATYVFTPLVRSMPKINFRNTMIATFLAMVISGIWHGSSWSFLFYGVLHGMALVVNHLWKKKKKKLSPLLAWFLTFNFVNISFIVFRAHSLRDAWKVFSGMIGLGGVVVPKIIVKSVGPLSSIGFRMGTYLYPIDYIVILMLLGSFYAIFKTKNSLELEREFKPNDRLAVLCGFAFVLCLFGMNRVTEFIYLKF